MSTTHSRRDILKKGAVAGAVVWAIPMIESVPAYAATGSTGALVNCSFTYVIWKFNNSNTIFTSGFSNAHSGCTQFGGKPTPAGGVNVTCGNTTYSLNTGVVSFTGTDPWGTGIATRATDTQCGAALIQSGNTVTAATGVTILAAIAFGANVFNAACASSTQIADACAGTT